MSAPVRLLGNMSAPVRLLGNMSPPLRLRATRCCALPFAPTPPCAPASGIYGAALFAAAGLPDVRRVGVGVLAGNVVFAILVAVVLAAGWLPLTELGVVTTIAFTVATVGFAYVQYLGVRRLA